MSVKFLTGPVLYFRGLAEGRWRLAAIVATTTAAAPPPLRVNGGPEMAAEALGERAGGTVWRYDFSIPLEAAEEGVEYGIGERRWRIHPPPRRLRIAYTSCNGTEDDPLGGDDPQRHARWRHLAAEHAASPFHLLIQGGDQLYADDVWQQVPELAAWRRSARREQLAAVLSPASVAAVAELYFRHYCRLWAQPALAPLLASIPSLMMWDDHDIFDGWGSHAAELQQCPVFQAVWKVAREQFAWFQLGVRPERLPEGYGDPHGAHFGWSHRVGEVGIVAPDLRSERTRRQVMGENARRWLAEALADLAGCRHLLFVSTVPLINVDLSLLERIALLLPDHPRLYRDDMRDQWRSFAHRDEWLRLVGQLLDFSERTETRVTVLSGEIHLGALGRIARGATEILQLTSSGVVHPPPRKLARLFELWGHRAYTIAPGTRLSMLPLPGVGKRYLDARAWLELCVEPPLQARWHAEGDFGDIALTIE